MARESDFKRLVRLVARLFYSEGIPPPEESEANEPPKPTRKTMAGPNLGLGVIVLDALTRREWVQEDYIPKPHIEGEAKDTKAPGLAQQLRVHPKLLRRTLRMFERDDLFVRREHRKERAQRRRRPGDAIADASAATMLAGTEVSVDDDGEAAPKQHTHSYCCLDYPTIVDVVQLKLHVMRRALKEADVDAAPVAAYICPECGATFTSMDAIRLLDAEGNFVCDDCGTAVEQQLDNGVVGGEKERQERKAATRALLKTFEKATKPVQDLLVSLQGVKPPDYGSLQDWQIAKQHAAVLQQRRAAKGGGTALPATVNVELDMGTGPEKSSQPVAPKQQPAWMQRDGVVSSGAGDTTALAEAAAEAARVAAETDAAQRARAQEWQREQARLEAARSGPSNTMDSSSGFEPNAKRAKVSGGWSLVEDSGIKHQVKAEIKQEVKVEIGPEAGTVGSHIDGDDEDWEDV